MHCHHKCKNINFIKSKLKKKIILDLISWVPSFTTLILQPLIPSSPHLQTMGLFKKTTISTELTSSLSHVSNTSAAAGAATPGWIDDSKSKSKTKRASGRYSKIDLKNDDLSGPTYAVKGERGRKSLRGGTKDAQGKKIQNVIKGGVRGYVEGMDAYTTLTAGQIKKEEGWFFTMKPKRWRRFMWRVIMLPDEYAPTISNPDWFKEQKNRKMLKGHVRIFREYIDYFLGVRIKSKYSYHPYKLTFDFLGFNEWQAICMYWVFSKADKDGSGIISQFEWLMYLDVEKTEFNEKVSERWRQQKLLLYFSTP